MAEAFWVEKSIGRCSEIDLGNTMRNVRLINFNTKKEVVSSINLFRDGTGTGYGPVRSGLDFRPAGLPVE
jgi:hypothetical protein